jgi:hypothetical protein
LSLSTPSSLTILAIVVHKVHTMDATATRIVILSLVGRSLQGKEQKRLKAQRTSMGRRLSGALKVAFVNPIIRGASNRNLVTEEVTDV